MTALTGLYVSNLVLLILHEMDSVYWKEWELFKLKGGLTGFLILHVPLLVFFLTGLIWLYGGRPAGRIAAIASSAAGLGASIIHSIFLKKGRPEFNTPLSKMILWLTALNSLILGVWTIGAW